MKMFYSELPMKESVKFLFNGIRYDHIFDRSKLKLGKILHIKVLYNSQIQISEQDFKDSLRVSIFWIAPSEWLVDLVDSYRLDHAQVEATQKILIDYMSNNEVLDNLSYHVSKLRLEHLHKTSEFDKSSLRTIFAVVERLNFINSLKSEKVSSELFIHWEPVIVYHLLTCFDLLGQPDSWVSFDSWISSDKHKSEREELANKIDHTLDKVEFCNILHTNYNEIYSVKKSFFRFIREILPTDFRRDLLDSIKITTVSMPPNIRTISTDSSDDDKEKFLFTLRNNYTHKAKYMYGLNEETIFGKQGNRENIFLHKFQEFRSESWCDYMTKDWPNIIEESVKAGLSIYLKARKTEAKTSFTKYIFTHKYYRAFTPNGDLKTGVNRILFDFQDNEITREYVPDGLPLEFEWATIEQINKHNIVYPHIDAKRLTDNL